METFAAGVKPEWGYAVPQQDTFVVIHPQEDRKHAPLYVVLHSAGHDVMSCVTCTRTVGNHDIYRSPDDHSALYVDCRKHQAQDWWWGGMHGKDQGLIEKNSGGDTMPVEKRVIDTRLGMMIIWPNRQSVLYLTDFEAMSLAAHNRSSTIEIR